MRIRPFYDSMVNNAMANTNCVQPAPYLAYRLSRSSLHPFSTAHIKKYETNAIYKSEALQQRYPAVYVKFNLAPGGLVLNSSIFPDKIVNGNFVFADLLTNIIYLRTNPR